MSSGKWLCAGSCPQNRHLYMRIKHVTGGNILLVHYNHWETPLYWRGSLRSKTTGRYYRYTGKSKVIVLELLYFQVHVNHNRLFPWKMPYHAMHDQRRKPPCLEFVFLHFSTGWPVCPFFFHKTSFPLLPYACWAGSAMDRNQTIVVGQSALQTLLAG